ncbi:unnamed protein product [Blepharisma stoltei]|uniref:Sec24-like protein n=1 Tax=Blepharisma stoltei TaxID=1481888 RepID=A0AAU9ICS2_9CILI|nr:unnamed protein product [Blepharisma stoltei]
MSIQEGQNWSQLPNLDVQNRDQAIVNPSDIEENSNAEPYYEESVYQKLVRPCNRYDEFMGKFTANGSMPPPCLAQYFVKEQKVSNPRFLRFTCTNCSLNENIQYNIGIPLGAIWQPFAELSPEDDKVPLIEREPLRCTNCLAYMNAHFKFSNNDFKCNICGYVQKYSKEYFKSQGSFPEFSRGTYKYLISKELQGSIDKNIYYLVCIDITNFSLGLGVYQQVLSSIRDILNYIPNPEIVKIGIITYDSFLHFFSLNNSPESIQEVIVSDENDLFIPFHFSSLCYNAQTEKEKIENLIDSLLGWEFSEISKNTLPVATIIDLVKNHFKGDAACRLLLFSSKAESLKTEKLNYLGSLEEFIRLGKECTENSLCVDLFLFSNSVDISSLATLSSQTGGDIYYYPKYLSKYDGEKLYYQLLRIFTRPQVFDANMRIRCSIKMAIDDCIGNFIKKSPVEMQVAAIDSDKSIGIMLKYDGVLVENEKVYLQCAILYRNNLGQKILRIYNGLMIADENSKFTHTEYGDLDTINNILVKKYAKMMFEKQLQNVKSDWYNFIYRVTNYYGWVISGAGSDVLKPHFVDMLPLFYNTANKLAGLSFNQSISDDIRLVSSFSLYSISSSKLRLLLYPNIYKLHDIMAQPRLPGTASSSTTIYLPDTVPCKRESLSPEGVYLLANGDIIVIFIGKNAPEEFLIKLFGKPLDQLSKEEIDIKNIGTEESERISLIINESRIKNPNGIPPLYFYLEEKDNYELIKQFMVEDQNGNETSYELFVENINSLVQYYED